MISALRGSATSEEPSGRGELPGVLPASCQPGAGLAYPPPLVPVAVLRRQIMPPFAFDLARVGGRDGLAARHVHNSRHGFPVRRVLAGPVLAGVAARTVRISVMAYVIDRLARLQRADKLGKAVAVSARAACSPGVECAIPIPPSAASPRPAVFGSALVYVRKVAVKSCQARQHRLEAERISVLPQLFVMSVAQILCNRRPVTFAARPHHGPVPGLKRIPVDHEPPVVSDTQSPEVRGPVAMQAIGHSSSLPDDMPNAGHLAR